MDEELKRAAILLAPEYYRAVMALGMPVEDIRLRLGRPVSCCMAGREHFLRQLPVLSEKNLLWTLERATCSSIYSVQDTLRQGYINASSGIRIGVCGTGVIKNGGLATIKDISSLSIRVARQCRGIARRIYALRCRRTGRKYAADFPAGLREDKPSSRHGPSALRPGAARCRCG